LLRWLVPLAAILGGYLLWVGAYAPGGAFQAGAVIAGAGVALKLSGRYRFIWQPPIARLLLCIGLAVFVLTGALCAGATAHVLEYPVEYAGLVILVIELAATVTIASVLLLLFTGLQDKMPSDAARGRTSS
jgi:multisubunit Na+/H+ antiporter MnhB subunit